MPSLLSTVITALSAASSAILGGTQQQTPMGPPADIASYGNDNILWINASFEQFIRDRMAEWNVPGLAIAILEGNKTWARGYGYAKLGSEPVTPSTLFCCGSMTKSFTAAALSLLVDNSTQYQNITWDSVVSEYIPDFVLSDNWTTEHITVRDALSHQTGYPSHNMAGPFLNSSALMIRSFRHLPVSSEPRVKFQYNNLMYASMGYLVEILTGSTLADFFRDKLWRPMGMDDTYLHPDDALRDGKPLASPQYWDNDTKTYSDIPWHDQTNIAGAGMAISSVLDWSRYLRHMIHETGPISEKGHHDLKSPVKIAAEEDDIFTGPSYYGLGWFGSVFNDEPVYYHSGRVNHMISLMVMIPGEDFGFVVMMNADGIGALDAIIARSLYDAFNVPEEDRFDMEAKSKHELEQLQQYLVNCSARLYPSLPSPSLPRPLPLEELAGTYSHPGYGNMTVSRRCEGWHDPEGSPASPTLDGEGCRLVASKTGSFGIGASFHLEHKSGDLWIGWYFDTDEVKVRWPGDCQKVEFRDSADGRLSFGVDTRHSSEGEYPMIWFDRVG